MRSLYRHRVWCIGSRSFQGENFFVRKGRTLFRTLTQRLSFAGIAPLPFEAACLLCEVVTEDELQRLGLYALNCMHQSMTNGGGGEHIARLRLVKYQQENIVLNVDYTKACFETGREGYAYLVSQTPTNS